MIFLKPNTALVPNGATVEVPFYSSEMHHEVEVVVVMAKEADNIEPRDAWDYLWGVSIGLDLTLRDVQTDAKRSGSPWTLSKGFKGSAPIGNIIPLATARAHDPSLSSLSFTLTVNGNIRQSGSLSQMERSIPELVSYVSKTFGLRQGDCIFTGTPEGVAHVKPGDTLVASLSDLVSLTTSIGSP
jgi:2-keto-4-pentenoate hydratase/2-oxohepta-3-ene-1,7-dioic acid hydratase in catechol pathway